MSDSLKQNQKAGVAQSTNVEAQSLNFCWHRIE